MASSILVPIKSDSGDSSNCSIYDPNAPSFLKNHDLIKEGDTVIIYVSYGHTHTIIVKRGITLAMKYGALRHEFIIDKPWGSKITATAGYVYALRPTPDLWTRSLPRRTQILYTPDCSLILQLLDARPGMVICESGTGSGSLSHGIALAIAPNGHLYTHDIEESRTKKIEQEFQEHGLSDITTAVVQNVCTEGFFVQNACDGVFLDVPAPWEAIPHAANALSKSRGGRLVSFSPCIEQVQRACEVMRSLGFVLIETVECVPTTLKVVKCENLTLEEFDKSGDFLTSGNRAPLNRKRRVEGDLVVMPAQEEEPAKDNLGRSAIAYPQNQPTHTGYLTHATMLPYN
ncbi:unnamed protein product [Auanema sp. JU1783]|nr:unnamed protein product [Auanema sp. JU1783]